MEKIDKIIATKLWNIYKKQYPKKSASELFCIIFADMAKEGEIRYPNDEKRS